MAQGRAVVAVVDDDARLLESMQDLLESANYSVLCFPSAASLLAEGLSGVDVLVTDIGMPGMDGFELRDTVEKLRPDLSVFLITGRHELADQGRAQGVRRMFRKPFDTHALLVAIGEALGDREGTGKHER
jgi:FixJ family two-component response regulator